MFASTQYVLLSFDMLIFDTDISYFILPFSIRRFSVMFDVVVFISHICYVDVDNDLRVLRMCDLDVRIVGY